MIKKIHELEEKDILIELADGNKLIDIHYDSTSYGGYCSTCDYGAHSVTDITLVFEKSHLNRCIDYRCDGTEPLFTESQIILFFTKNVEELSKMNYEEFISFIKDRYNIV